MRKPLVWGPTVRLALLARNISAQLRTGLVTELYQIKEASMVQRIPTNTGRNGSSSAATAAHPEDLEAATLNSARSNGSPSPTNLNPGSAGSPSDASVAAEPSLSACEAASGFSGSGAKLSPAPESGSSASSSSSAAAGSAAATKDGKDRRSQLAQAQAIADLLAQEHKDDAASGLLNGFISYLLSRDMAESKDAEQSASACAEDRFKPASGHPAQAEASSDEQLVALIEDKLRRHLADYVSSQTVAAAITPDSVPVEDPTAKPLLDLSIRGVVSGIAAIGGACTLAFTTEFEFTNLGRSCFLGGLVVGSFLLTLLSGVCLVSQVRSIKANTLKAALAKARKEACELAKMQADTAKIWSEIAKLLAERSK